MPINFNENTPNPLRKEDVTMAVPVLGDNSDALKNLFEKQAKNKAIEKIMNKGELTEKDYLKLGAMDQDFATFVRGAKDYYQTKAQKQMGQEKIADALEAGKIEKAIAIATGLGMENQAAVYTQMLERQRTAQADATKQQALTDAWSAYDQGDLPGMAEIAMKNDLTELLDFAKEEMTAGREAAKDEAGKAWMQQAHLKALTGDFAGAAQMAYENGNQHLGNHYARQGGIINSGDSGGSGGELPFDPQEFENARKKDDEKLQGEWQLDPEEAAQMENMVARIQTGLMQVPAENRASALDGILSEAMNQWGLTDEQKQQMASMLLVEDPKTGQLMAGISDQNLIDSITEIKKDLLGIDKAKEGLNLQTPEQEAGVIDRIIRTATNWDKAMRGGGGESADEGEPENKYAQRLLNTQELQGNLAGNKETAGTPPGARGK